MKSFSRATILLAVLAVLGVGIAGVAYVGLRTSCETDPRGIVGEVRRMPDASFEFYDGKCWSARPLPPTDTPF